jgi:predicted anti-sigma-YlaC factor YlaD
MGRSEARCRAAQQSFEAGLFGNLDSGDRLALREHLVGCEACRRRARLLTARLENLADFDLTGLMELRLRWQAELDQRRSGPLMILGALVLCLSWLSAGVFFAARPSEEQREAGRPDSEIAPIDSAQAASVESVRGGLRGLDKSRFLGDSRARIELWDCGGLD